MKEAAAIDYQQKYQELQGQYEVLKAELMQLKRLIFTSKQERFLPTDTTSSSQLSLDIQPAEAPGTIPSAAVITQRLFKKVLLTEYIFNALQVISITCLKQLYFHQYTYCKTLNRTY